jgi:D-alanyl-D-alanine carboxypeptidase
MKLKQLAIIGGLSLTFAFNGAAEAHHGKRHQAAKKKPVAAAVPPPSALAIFVCVAPAQPSMGQDCLPLEGDSFNKNADELVEPASLVKLMTAYMVYKSGPDKLDDPFITLTAQDRIDGSIGMRNGRVAGGGWSPPQLKPGMTLTRREAIWSLTGASANNVAVASAKALAPDGKESTFAQMMTDEARNIGLKKTTFRNATGMPWDGQLTSAREVARLMNFIPAAIGAEQFKNLFGQENIVVQGIHFTKGRQEVGNRIDLVRAADLDVMAAKTGSMRDQATGRRPISNIAIAFNEKGQTIYTIVLGSTNESSRDKLVRQLASAASKLIPSAQAAEPVAPR